jgi:hypothetical protein
MSKQSHSSPRVLNRIDPHCDLGYVEITDFPSTIVLGNETSVVLPAQDAHREPPDAHDLIADSNEPIQEQQNHRLIPLILEFPIPHRLLWQGMMLLLFYLRRIHIENPMIDMISCFIRMT